MEHFGKKDGPRRDFGDPLSVLSDCHDRIHRFLGVLNEAANAGGRALTDDEDVMLERVCRFFREAGARHAMDEEESLFPRLRKKDGPEVAEVITQCEALDKDHRTADALHNQVEQLIIQWRATDRLGNHDAKTLRSAVNALMVLYEPHMAYEENVLFPLCARLFSAGELAEIGEEMKARRNR